MDATVVVAVRIGFGSGGGVVPPIRPVGQRGEDRSGHPRQLASGPVLTPAQPVREGRHHAHGSITRDRAAVTSGAGKAFEMNRWQTGVGRSGRTESSATRREEPRAVITIRIPTDGFATDPVAAEVTTHAGQRLDAYPVVTRLADEAADQIMADAVAMTVGARHAGLEVDVVVMEPIFTNPGTVRDHAAGRFVGWVAGRFDDPPLAVTLPTGFVGGAADDVEVDLAVGLESPFGVGDGGHPLRHRG